MRRRPPSVVPNSLLLLVSLLSVIFFQSTLSKSRQGGGGHHHLDHRGRHRRAIGTNQVFTGSDNRVTISRPGAVVVKRRRHSGRLLGRPNPVKCARRPRTVRDGHSGHYYFFSDDTNYRGHKVSWLDARNLCRERCMDLVSIESKQENDMIVALIKQRNIREVWTSGRLCNFPGCDKPHLQPRHINGWFWSGSGISIAPTNSTPPGWGRRPWSHTGFIGQFLAQPVGQPDNAEYLINPSFVTVEACLAVLNDWYEDGVSWHDVACYRKKPFVCEDSEVLMRRARALNPSVTL